MCIFKAMVLAIESTLFEGGGGLYFKWCQGGAVGVGNQYNCVGAPTTFGRHRSFRQGKTVVFMKIMTHLCPQILVITVGFKFLTV